MPGLKPGEQRIGGRTQLHTPIYNTLRSCLRAALHCYFGRIHLHIGAAYSASGSTLLLACNHPNSFLDALLVGTHLPMPMHFLARGEGFRHPLAAWVLRKLYMHPVYRIRGGRSDLQQAEASFSGAQRDLERGLSVLVFAEGVSVQTTSLRPLGKGTARIAHRAWNAGLNMQVLPVWIAYGSIRKPFRQVTLCTGTTLASTELALAPEGLFLHRFNTVLRQRLLAASAVAAAIETTQPHKKRLTAQIALAIPALLGLTLHLPWYLGISGATWLFTRHSVFFDAVRFALLFLTYPLWLLLLTSAGLGLGLNGYAWLAWIAAPLCLYALRAWHQSR